MLYWPTIHNLILKICPEFQVLHFHWSSQWRLFELLHSHNFFLKHISSYLVLTEIWLLTWTSCFHCFEALAAWLWALSHPHVWVWHIGRDCRYCIASEHLPLKKAWPLFFLEWLQKLKKNQAYCELFPYPTRCDDNFPTVSYLSYVGAHCLPWGIGVSYVLLGPYVLRCLRGFLSWSWFFKITYICI